MAQPTALAERPTAPPINLTVVGDANDSIPDAPVGSNPWSIALSTVNDAIQKLGLPDNQAAALRWVRNFGFSNRKSVADVAKLLSYDKNTLYKILTGRHGAKLDSFTTEVEAFRKKFERSATKDFPFTETETGAFINSVCDLAISSGRIALLVGRSHCGKSANLREYPRRHNYGEVHYVRTPSGGHAHAFKIRLAKAKAVSGKYNATELSELILESFRPDKAVVIDEWQETAPDGEKPRQKTVSYAREIHDTTGVPLILAMHEEAFTRMQEARHAQLYKPLLNRSLDPFYLDDEPGVADMNAYAARIGLPPATGPALDLQTTIVRDKSLGSWLTLLLRSIAYADNRKEPFTWDSVRAVDRIFARKGRK